MFSIFVQCTRAQYEALYERYRMKHRVVLFDVDPEYNGGHYVRVIGPLAVFLALSREGLKPRLRYFAKPIDMNGFAIFSH